MLSSNFEWDVTSAELFRFLGQPFDVRQAKRIIHSLPREVNNCNIVEAAELIHPRPPAVMALKVSIKWNELDQNYEKYDLSIPLIGIKFRDSYLIIDGWHRIAKASEKNIVELPIVLLSDEESKELGSPILSHEEEKFQNQARKKTKTRKKK